MQQLLVLSLIGLAIFCGASQVAARGEIQTLATKLEQFAKDPKSKSTGLTYEFYEAAYWDAKESLPQEFLEERRRVSPGFRLLEDFVLTPMDRWRLSANDDEVFKQAYVNRIEQTFKRFWPSYVSGTTINSRMMYSARKFLGFVKSLQKKVREQPTLEMWDEAIEQYEALKQRANEMVRNEDIYDKLDEYEHLMNFFNDFNVKTLMERYAARFEGCEDMKQMQKVIVEYRKLYGI